MASPRTEITHDYRRDLSQSGLPIGSLFIAVAKVTVDLTSYHVSLDGNMPILLYQVQYRRA